MCVGNNIRRFIGNSNIKVSEYFESALGMRIKFQARNISGISRAACYTTIACSGDKVKA